MKNKDMLEASNKYEKLKIKIDRMMSANYMEELDSSYYYALFLIENIYSYNKKRLKEVNT